MRGYKSIIQEAELLAMSPEAVSEFLKRRAKQSIDEQDHDPVDEKAEEALHGRSSPLIDLALARYARFMETVRPIFQSSQSCSAIRLAVLSNTAVSENIFDPFPVGLFGDRKQEAQEQAAAWLAEAPREELQALFENPRINDDFLSDLLKRSKPWDAVPDECLVTIVAILGRNERMRHTRSDTTANEYVQELAESMQMMVVSVYKRLNKGGKKNKVLKPCPQTPQTLAA